MQRDFKRLYIWREIAVEVGSKTLYLAKQAGNWAIMSYHTRKQRVQEMFQMSSYNLVQILRCHLSALRTAARAWTGLNVGISLLRWHRYGHAGIVGITVGSRTRW